MSAILLKVIDTENSIRFTLVFLIGMLISLLNDFFVFQERRSRIALPPVHWWWCSVGILTGGDLNGWIWLDRDWSPVQTGISHHHHPWGYYIPCNENIVHGPIDFVVTCAVDSDLHVKYNNTCNSPLEQTRSLYLQQSTAYYVCKSQWQEKLISCSGSMAHYYYFPWTFAFKDAI